MSDDNQRPGWTYLTGQQKSKEVVEAKNAADKAWLEYEQSINETTGTGNNILHERATRLQNEADCLSAEWNRNYKD